MINIASRLSFFLFFFFIQACIPWCYGIYVFILAFRASSHI